MSSSAHVRAAPGRRRVHLRPAAALAALLVAWPGAARATDLYAFARGREQSLVERGQLVAAAQALEAIEPLYPQDYALALSIAAAEYRAGRFALAEKRYRRVLELSPGALDAILGVGRALQQQGRCAEAMGWFHRLLGPGGDYPGGREGVAACAPAPAVRLTAALFSAGRLYDQVATRGAGATLGTSLAATLFERWTLGVSYAFTAQALGPLPDATEHDLFLHAGYAGERASVTLHYALVDDRSGYFGESHHLGVTGRLPDLGDAELDLAASLYGDGTVLRGELADRFALGGGLWLRPALVGQRYSTTPDGSGLTGSAALTLGWDQQRFGLWLSGSVGEAVRPALLSSGLVLDLPQRTAWSLGAGARLALGSGLSLALDYRQDRLRTLATSGSGTDQYGLGHTLGLALLGRF